MCCGDGQRAVCYRCDNRESRRAADPRDGLPAVGGGRADHQ